MKFGVYQEGLWPSYGALKIFDTGEEAVVFAQRSARQTKVDRIVAIADPHKRRGEILAEVSSCGQVDLTWRGSELISCFPKKRAISKS